MSSNVSQKAPYCSLALSQEDTEPISINRIIEGLEDRESCWSTFLYLSDRLVDSPRALSAG
jgi:hypothetical protein